MSDPSVVAASATQTIAANPNASSPAGAARAARARIGMYPNITPNVLASSENTSAATAPRPETRSCSEVVFAASTSASRAKPHAASTNAAATKEAEMRPNRDESAP